MGNKVLYISDGNSVDDYFIRDNLGDTIDFVENVNFIIDSSTFANPRFVSVDWLYSQKVEGINYNDYDLIVIPSSLSNDVYFSFSGIRLAIHFRLFRESKFLPILIIGPESFMELCKFSDYSGFLSSRGIYTLRDENNTVLDIYPYVREILSQHGPISENVYWESLKKITVEPISFLDSRHSRANEYGLLKLYIESGHNIELSNERSLEIVADLHTKLLLTQSGLQIPKISEKTNVKQGVIIQSTGKRILVIEDEWKKGWLHLYRKILHGAEVDYLPIEKGFSWTNDIEPLLLKKLEEENWDLFLVDIRLTDDDFKTEDHTKLSGFKAIECIKAKNSGYQVCVTTASNKQWIYDFAMTRKESKADQFFIKPSLDHKKGLLLLEKSIKFLYNGVSQELRHFWLDFEKAKSLVKSKKAEKKIENKGKKIIESYLLYAFDFLQKSAYDEAYLESALNSLYLVIEAVGSKLFSDAINIDGNSYTYCWKGTDERIKMYDWKGYKESTWQKPYKDGPNGKTEFISHKDKLANLLSTNKQLTLKQIHDLVELRNGLSHPTLVVKTTVNLNDIKNALIAVSASIDKL
jgi:hypothetical protein